MAKFQVLKTSRVYMARLGIYSNRLTEPTNEFLKSIMSCVIVILLSCAFTSSVLFMVKYYYKVKPALGAFKIVVSAGQCLGMFMGIGFKMCQVKALHLELQRLVDEAEDNKEVHNIYWNCEQQCRMCTQRFAYFMFFHTFSLFAYLIYAIVCMAFGKYDTSAWALPFFMVVPFDQTSIIGWFLTWVFESSIGVCYGLSMTSVTGYFINCCYYLRGMCEHFNVLVNTVTESVKRWQKEKKTRKFEGKYQVIIAQMATLVKFQVQIYDIFNILADIINVSIFALLPFNVIYLSISMYDVEMSVTHFNQSVLLFDVSCILTAIFWPGFISYSANHATSRILLIGDMVYESNWYEYPPQLQKHFILIIGRFQQEVYFNGMGIIYCSLENFGKLCRTSASYYMIFRAFDQR